MAVVYKLTRMDGLEYIGITVNMKRRMSEHKKTKRFEQGIKDCIVLFEGEYEECQELEGVFIEQFDTYKNGLNMTPQGKGKTEDAKFNTYGMKFSDEHRKKLRDNHWSKKGLSPWTKGKKNYYEVTDKLRKTRSDNARRENTTRKTLKLTTVDVININNRFREFSITLELAIKYCKKSHIDLLKSGEISIEQAINKGGKPLNIVSIFANEICSEYNCTPNAIGLVLNK